MSPGRTYLPGKLAVMSADFVLVAWVPVAGRPSAVEMWGRFAGGASAVELLAVLTQEGLVDLPDFAVACLEGPVLRTFVRGGLDLRIEGSTPGSVSGEGFLTWREDSWTKAGRVTVCRTGADVDGTAMLPIGAGVVWAEAFAWDVPEPAPAPGPVPAIAVIAETDPGIEAEPLPDADPAPAGDVEPVVEAAIAVPSSAEDWSPIPPPPVIGAGMMMLPPVEEPTVEPGADGSVRVATCSRGHTNPEDGYACRACGEPLDTAPRTWVDAVVPGVLRSPDGQVYVIDGPLVLGREPGPPGYVNGERPRWCLVGGPGYEVSRSHLEVRVDGWVVTVVDLDSTNGTALIAPDGTTYSLAPQVPAVLEPGWTLVLAELVNLRYEVQ